MVKERLLCGAFCRPAEAQRLGAVKSVTQFLVEDPSKGIVEPSALVQADDGSLIIAGKIHPPEVDNAVLSKATSPWVARVTVDGKLQWSYSDPGWRSVVPAEFSGVALIGQGRIAACGWHSAKEERPLLPALLSILDTDGRLVARKEFGGAQGSFYFRDCARVGDGVIAVADATIVDGPGRFRRRHMFTTLDVNGIDVWLHDIPYGFESAPDLRSVRVMVTEGKAFVSSADGHSSSEIFRLDFATRSVERLRISGRHIVVRSIFSDIAHSPTAKSHLALPCCPTSSMHPAGSRHREHLERGNDL